MPLPTANDRPEPHLAAPGTAPAREPGPLRSLPPRDAESAAAPLRFPAATRRAERPITPFSAGERLAVASTASGGDDRPRRGPSMIYLSLLLILLFFAGIGAVTVYHAVAGVLPG